MGFSDAKYQAHQTFIHNTAATLTSGTSTLVTVPVVLDKIQIIEFGMIPTAAFSDSSTMTTRPVVQLQKTTVAGVTAILNSLATITPSYSQAAQVITQVDLDTNTAAAGTNTPIAGPDAYPTAVAGDNLLIVHTTQGVGGTQTAKFYFKYREIEAS